MIKKKSIFGFLSESKSRTTDDPNSYQVIVADVPRVNVFFDGTLNNIFNTEDARSGKAIKGQASYANAETAIGLMWRDGLDNQKEHFVYIEGIGTTRHEKDSPAGYAVGMGESGIIDRAISAFDAIEKQFIKNQKEAFPLQLNVNVYGFSRGAAAARYFVQLVNDASKQHYTKKLKDTRMRIHFVGLFDCVSSHGGNFSNDVQPLQLAFQKYTTCAKKIIHLVAGDEYRANFAVTNIDSAGDKGTEITLPGAHSDIGGGYPPQEKESRSLKDTALRQFVYEQGWYTEKDLIQIAPPPPTYAQPAYDTTGAGYYLHQRQVQGEYSKIAHSIMVNIANDFLGDKVLADPPAIQDPEIKALHSVLLAFAMNAYQTDQKTACWDLNKEQPAKAKAIRRKYLHFSVNPLEVVMRHRQEGGKPKRQIIQG